MPHISELSLIISPHLDWHKPRIKLFSMALLSLLICKDINLYKIAVSMSSKANIDSRYKRLKRFLSNFIIDYDDVARCSVPENYGRFYPSK